MVLDCSLNVQRAHRLQIYYDILSAQFNLLKAIIGYDGKGKSLCARPGACVGLSSYAIAAVP